MEISSLVSPVFGSSRLIPRVLTFNPTRLVFCPAFTCTHVIIFPGKWLLHITLQWKVSVPKGFISNFKRKKNGAKCIPLLLPQRNSRKLKMISHELILPFGWQFLSPPLHQMLQSCQLKEYSQGIWHRTWLHPKRAPLPESNYPAALQEENKEKYFLGL